MGRMARNVSLAAVSWAKTMASTNTEYTIIRGPAVVNEAGRRLGEVHVIAPDGSILERFQYMIGNYFSFSMAKLDAAKFIKSLVNG